MFIRNYKISEIVNDSDSDVVVLVSLKTRCYNNAKAGRGSQISKEKMSLEILYEKVAEGLLANTIQKKLKLKVRLKAS
jgi:hypothetical protein